MSNDFVLELSTQVVPGKQFSVDGEAYDLVNADHLSEDDEARIMGKFSLHFQIIRKLDRARNEAEARKLAKDLRRSRIELITELTSVPKDIVQKLPLTAQSSIIEAVQEELGVLPEGDEQPAA